MLVGLEKLKMLAAATVLLCVFNQPPKADANSDNYALSRVINVALLRIPSSGQSGTTPTGGSLKAPYIFDILNNRPDVKPTLWKLQNPLAPATVDTETNSRYDGLYTPDQQVLPDMAPYWELDLNKIGSASQLAQYNLLVIRTDGDIDMTVTERRILRQYVDQGGTLWIDGSGNGTTFDPDKSDLFRVAFNGGAVQDPISYHPLATTPYSFTSQNLAGLGYGIANSHAILNDTGGTADVSMFQQIGGSLIAGDYGAGHVIIDGLGVGDLINAEGQTTLPYSQANIPYYVSIYDSANGIPLTTAGYDATNYSGSPASDLQFLVNVISYATSSQNPGANVRGNGNQGGNLSGALTASWQSLFGGNDAPEGIATAGKFVYTTDTAGNLNCFDINPSESIFADANSGDDGFPDYSKGTSYDLVWSVSLGVALSSPVIALLPAGNGNANTETVLVEDINGNVYGYPAVWDSGGSTTPPGQLFKLGNASGTPFGATVPPYTNAIIPSPTYYRGEILAAQPGTTGLLDIYYAPFGGSTSNSFPVNAGAWIESPLVASVPSADGTYVGDEVVGYAVTSSGVQTLELGSRDEALSPQAGGVSAASSTYSSRAGQLSSTTNDALVGAPEDTNGIFAGSNWLLDFVSPENSGDVFNFSASGTPLANSITTTLGNDLPDIYADYDVIEGTSPPIRTQLPASLADGNGAGNYVVGAAVGQDNIVYITVNEPGGGSGSAYIEAVNEQAPVNTNSSILWRFELTGSSSTITGNTTYTVTDASGIDYDFNGYQFVGPPVVGNNGLVYALARYTNGALTSTRLMAFNANPTVGIDNPFSDCSITEQDEFGTTENVPTTQFTGDWQVSNFSPSKTGTLAPSLYAPGVLEVQQLENNQGVTTAVGAPIPVSINTAYNGASPMLEWYTQLPVFATSAPRMVGDYIYFGYTGTSAGGIAETGTASVLGNPSHIGLSPDPETRVILPGADYRFLQAVPSRDGAVQFIAGSNQYLLTSGSGGIEGLSYNSIVVADGNRLVELDPDGNALWTIDSTQEPAQSLGAVIANPTTGTTLISPSTSSSVALDRPSTVAQISTNDFLIADTGNNRCVHVDSSGNVLTQLTDSFGNVLLAQPGTGTPGNFQLLAPSSGAPAPYALEFTSFSDPLGILPVGQPMTLNRPSSVTTWLTYEYGNGTGNGTYATAINAHYLIADTGNDRLLDIVDRYTEITNNGTPTNQYAIMPNQPVGITPAYSDFHYLNWISHTSDIANRAYAYVGGQAILSSGAGVIPPTLSAVYPDGTNQEAAAANQATGIIGVVGDKNIQGLDFTQPSNFAQNNQDGSGSSILLFNYSNGITFASNKVPKTGLPISLINSVSFNNPANNYSATTYPLRGLRSAIATLYTTVPPAFGSFVIADDDGVFNGTFATGTNTNLNGNYLLDATYGPTSIGWEFTQYDYDSQYAPLGPQNADDIVIQYDNALAEISPLTTGTYQNYQPTPFVPASAVPLSGNNYLIVNRGASGNINQPAIAGNADNGFGGNVFTVHATVSGANAPVDLLDGPIYGSPANTGALSTPAFALRSN